LYSRRLLGVPLLSRVTRDGVLFYPHSNAELLLPRRLEDVHPPGEAMAAACARNDTALVHRLRARAGTDPRVLYDMAEFRDSRALRVACAQVTPPAQR
jgi:hypothetical protein